MESQKTRIDGTKATATAATVADPVGPTVDFRQCHMPLDLKMFFCNVAVGKLRFA